MNHRIRIFLSLCMIFPVAAGSLSAQSLFDNAYHRKAVDLQNKAEAAFDRGEYDDSIRMSKDAKIFTSLSELYGTLVFYRFKANSVIVFAKERVSFAERIRANENFPSEYTTAVASLGDAVRLFGEGEINFKEVLDYLRNADVPEITKTPFDNGIALFIESSLAGSQAISSLEGIRIVIRKPEPVKMPEVVASPPEEKPAPVEVAVQKEPEPIVLALPAVDPRKSDVLPKYYVVRLIEERRDCFWRIAEYGFIYGDPWKWKVLYEANKGKLPDPKDPNWLEPGIMLEIPSVGGEVREGIYDPEKTYPEF